MTPYLHRKAVLKAADAVFQAIHERRPDVDRLLRELARLTSEKPKEHTS